MRVILAEVKEILLGLSLLSPDIETVILGYLGCSGLCTFSSLSLSLGADTIEEIWMTKSQYLILQSPGTFWKLRLREDAYSGRLPFLQQLDLYDPEDDKKYPPSVLDAQAEEIERVIRLPSVLGPLYVCAWLRMRYKEKTRVEDVWPTYLECVSRTMEVVPWFSLFRATEGFADALSPDGCTLLIVRKENISIWRREDRFMPFLDIPSQIDISHLFLDCPVSGFLNFIPSDPNRCLISLMCPTITGSWITKFLLVDLRLGQTIGRQQTEFEPIPNERWFPRAVCLGNIVSSKMEIILAFATESNPLLHRIDVEIAELSITFEKCVLP